MRSAVLFVIFNRPETTRQVFEAIRTAAPPKLYIAADGPRPNRPEEAQRCDEARIVANSVDWPCEVLTLYRDNNLGCKLGVSGAVDWFFEHESEGVILEDDVLPVATFFDFCDQMLERFRNDARVAMISGCNLVSNHFSAKDSYFFSRYTHIWGWATWRRAWSVYDVDMKAWPEWRDCKGLAKVAGGSRFFESYWRRTFDSVHAGRIDTWDFQWTFACWRVGGLTVLPASNQTRNLGFGAGATHTTGDIPQFVLASAPRPLGFPLSHPDRVEREIAADEIIHQKLFGIGLVNIMKLRLLAIPIVGDGLAKVKIWAKSIVH